MSVEKEKQFLEGQWVSHDLSQTPDLLQDYCTLVLMVQRVSRAIYLFIYLFIFL